MHRIVYIIICSITSMNFISIAAAYNKDSVLSIIEAQRDSIDSFYTQTYRVQAPIIEDKSHSAKIYPQMQYLQYEFAKAGNKVRYQELYGQNKDAIVYNKINIWNGKVVKTHTISDNLGTVDRNPQKEKFEVINDPVQFAMLKDTTASGSPDYGQDVVALLKSEYSSIEPQTEIVNGHECIVVTLKYKDYTSYKVWLDPKLSFAVRRKVNYNPEDCSKMWYQIENDAFVDCGNGLYLPSKTKKTKYLFKEHPCEEWGKESLVENFESPIVSINKELPEELFDIQYPEGTLLIDNIAGLTYTVGVKNIEDVLDVSFDEFLELQKDSNVYSRNAAEKSMSPADVSGKPESNIPDTVVAENMSNRSTNDIRLTYLAFTIVCLTIASSVVVARQKRIKGKGGIV